MDKYKKYFIIGFVFVCVILINYSSVIAQTKRTIQPDTSKKSIQKLAEKGFVHSAEANGVNKYHVTLSGMRKVLSTYS